MKTALVIPIYNRPEYVKRCFASLEALTVKPDIVILVDDGSVCEIPELKIEHYRSRQPNNLGVKATLLNCIETAFMKGADLVINLDSDAVVKPDFITKLLSRGIPEQGIVSGFNCVSKGNPILKDYGDHCTKAFGNGINMCFNKAKYEKYIKPSLLKEGNWDYNTSLACQKDNLPFIIIKPSVVQHIGLQSSMGHIGADVAQDFKMLELPTVTLFGIDSHNPTGIHRAAEISQRDIQFGAVNIITKDIFTKGGSNEQRRSDYSRFMMKSLTEYFDTSHVLTIHHDGYVLNWEAWDNDWLQYDYIGATWNYKDGMNVGNGGFSLRSKKLCEILANNDLEGEYYHPEDHHIGRTYRPALEAMGIKYAPEEVANKFSIEAYGTTFGGANRYSGQFGFHGPHVDLSALPVDIQYKRGAPQPQKTGKKRLTLLNR